MLSFVVHMLAKAEGCKGKRKVEGPQWLEPVGTPIIHLLVLAPTARKRKLSFDNTGKLAETPSAHAAAARSTKSVMDNKSGPLLNPENGKMMGGALMLKNGGIHESQASG